jgi:hypothetical protein
MDVASTSYIRKNYFWSKRVRTVSHKYPTKGLNQLDYEFDDKAAEIGYNCPLTKFYKLWSKRRTSNAIKSIIVLSEHFANICTPNWSTHLLLYFLWCTHLNVSIISTLEILGSSVTQERPASPRLHTLIYWLVNTVMNFRFPYKAENFLSNWGTSSFSRRTLLHVVSQQGSRTNLFWWQCYSIQQKYMVKLLRHIRVHNFSMRIMKYSPLRRKCLK